MSAEVEYLEPLGLSRAERGLAGDLTPPYVRVFETCEGGFAWERARISLSLSVL